MAQCKQLKLSELIHDAEFNVRQTIPVDFKGKPLAGLNGATRSDSLLGGMIYPVVARKAVKAEQKRWQELHNGDDVVDVTNPPAYTVVDGFTRIEDILGDPNSQGENTKVEVAIVPVKGSSALMSLFLNTSRNDLHPIDIAIAAEKGHKESGIPYGEIAKLMGKSGAWMSAIRKCLKLDEKQRAKAKAEHWGLVAILKFVKRLEGDTPASTNKGNPRLNRELMREAYDRIMADFCNDENEENYAVWFAIASALEWADGDYENCSLEEFMETTGLDSQVTNAPPVPEPEEEEPGGNGTVQRPPVVAAAG